MPGSTLLQKFHALLDKGGVERDAFGVADRKGLLHQSRGRSRAIPGSATIGPIGERKLAVEPAMAVRKMNLCQQLALDVGGEAMSSLAALPAATKADRVRPDFLSARPKRIIAKLLVCLMTPGAAITVAM